MAHILTSLRINLHAVPLRRTLPARLSAPRQAPSPAAVPRAQAPAADESAYDSADDEVCGVDFITLEPIRGADCRRLREEEAQVAARAAAVAAANASRPADAHLSSTDDDGYDFFRGKLTPADQEASQQGEEAPPPPLSLRGHAAAPLDDVRPVYRASPLQEEFRRQRDASTSARILFLDDGGEFRAPLAAALLRHMLARLRVQLDADVECASLGPAVGIPARGGPSPELARTAAAMGVPLGPAGAAAPPRRFQEVADAVRYDLILVFDRFDRQEVLREVAILDALNPGGNYSGRVRLLGPYGMAARRAAPSKVAADIADPLYDAPGEENARRAALEAAAAQLAFACRGLATHLLDLQARCGAARGLTLRDALGLSLRCPLLAGEMPSQRDRAAQAAASRPPGGPAHPPAASDERYAVRAVNGLRRVVRRRDKPRGFWRDAANVDGELRAWMAAHDADRLPTQRDLRAAGASSLATAVDAHGGMAAAAARLGVPMAARRPNGHWDDFGNLERALRAFLRPEGPSNDLVMPSVRMLVAAGRGDIVRAIHGHGGMVEVAERLGVGVRRGGGWDEATVLAELRAAGAAGAGGALRGALPTRDQLLAAGRGDLAAAVLKLGGFGYFRELDLSTRSTRSRKGRAAAAAAAAEGALGAFGTAPRRLPMIEEVGAEVQAWLGGAGKGVAAPGVLPTRCEMEAAGRGDLWVAVQRIGGGRRMAEHLGLGWVETRGRRRKGGDGSSGSDAPAADPREEIHILDAYEEFVFV